MEKFSAAFGNGHLNESFQIKTVICSLKRTERTFLSVCQSNYLRKLFSVTNTTSDQITTYPPPDFRILHFCIAQTHTGTPPILRGLKKKLSIFSK